MKMTYGKHLRHLRKELAPIDNWLFDVYSIDTINCMSILTTSQAAKVIGVNKRTLMRWDKSGLLKAKRELVSNIRIYDEEVVEKVRQWFQLRNKHKAHLRKLGPIRSKIDKYIVTQPLSWLEQPKIVSLDEAKKAFNELHNWENQLEKIYKEYAEFTEDYYGKLEEIKEEEE